MIRCPRDGAELELHYKAAGKLEVDACTQCAGVWLDSAELAELCPTVSHLPERRDEVAFTPEVLGAEPFPCPRCPPLEGGARVLAKPIRVAGLLIDFCLACGGVWLDASEAAELLREPEAAPPATKSASPFRHSALELARTGETQCGHCKAAVERARLYAVAGGFVCGPCYFGSPEKHRDALARRSKPAEEDLFTSLARGLMDLYDELNASATARMRDAYRKR